MTRAIIVAFTLFTLFTAHVSASAPEVHCVAAAGTDGMVQLDCYGSVMQEAYERLVPRYEVYAALRPIAEEWSFSLERHQSVFPKYTMWHAALAPIAQEWSFDLEWREVA